MEWVILRVPVWAAPRVLNLSHLLRRTPTARNTDGKRAQASQSQTAYLQAMKVQHNHIAAVLKWPKLLKQKRKRPWDTRFPNWQNIHLPVGAFPSTCFYEHFRCPLKRLKIAGAENIRSAWGDCNKLIHEMAYFHHVYCFLPFKVWPTLL